MKTGKDENIAKDFTGGLSIKDLSSIVSVISKESKIESALIFGSRVKGNHKPDSDVDLALKGINVDHDTVNNVSYFLNEESDMPCRFDVLNFNKITK